MFENLAPKTLRPKPCAQNLVPNKRPRGKQAAGHANANDANANAKNRPCSPLCAQGGASNAPTGAQPGRQTDFRNRLRAENHCPATIARFRYQFDSSEARQTVRQGRFPAPEFALKKGVKPA